MSVPHHEDLSKRFFEQSMGIGARSFSNGRVGPDDDGDLCYAIARDPKYNVIRIRFAKPVEWIALDRESAEKLRDALTEKIMELRGITPTT